MIFSKRHRRGLSSGQIKIDLDQRLRTRLWRQLSDHDSEYWYQPNPPDPWSERTTVIAELAVQLSAIYGTDGLPEMPAQWSGDALKAFVVEGPPYATFDAIELFVQKDESSMESLTRSVNEIFVEEESPWRILNGEIVLLDSDFHLDALADEVATLVSGVGFQGAYGELKHARNDRLDGKSRSAIHNAGSSYESAMKALGAPKAGNAKQLVGHLASEGFFDELPVDLRRPFKKLVLMSLPFMRNEMGGHGQGKDEVPIPDAYADLAINLASTLEKFLLTLALERQLLPESAAERDSPEVDTTRSSDVFDDIPF